MRTKVRATAVGLVVAALGCACGSSSPGSPTPTPAPPGSYVNIAGNWSGTLESENFPRRTITMMVVQGGSCVDGAWTAAGSDWKGAISGYAGSDSYSGQISVEAVTDTGERCSGVGNASGEVGADTLRWTSPGFSAVGQCSGTLPKSVVISLHRT